jgi:hypothetical protein
MDLLKTSSSTIFYDSHSQNMSSYTLPSTVQYCACRLIGELRLSVGQTTDPFVITIHHRTTGSLHEPYPVVSGYILQYDSARSTPMEPTSVRHRAIRRCFACLVVSAGQSDHQWSFSHVAPLCVFSKHVKHRQGIRVDRKAPCTTVV